MDILFRDTYANIPAVSWLFQPAIELPPRLRQYYATLYISSFLHAIWLTPLPYGIYTPLASHIAILPLYYYDT